MRSVILALSVLCVRLSRAHFLLNYPPSLGFDDGTEGTAPCGGFAVAFNGSEPTVPVDGFPVAVLSTHPQAQWLFRATLSKQEPFNWTNLLPVVDETGLGHFCIPNLSAPAEFVGQQGLVQVIQDAADGELYQCAAVNFVAGTNSSVGSSCQNDTGLTVTITNQNAFNATAASQATTPASSIASATSSATAASATTSSSSAASNPSSSVPIFFGLGISILSIPAVWGLVLY